MSHNIDNQLTKAGPLYWTETMSICRKLAEAAAASSAMLSRVTVATLVRWPPVKCITENNTEFHAVTSKLEFSNYDLEQFHGIPWNLDCINFADTSSSMEFHGIPWNLECANFDDIGSSVEFHGTCGASFSMTRAVPSNSTEFHGTWSAPISLTRAIPWNSMEFQGSLDAPILLTRAVPWNFIYIHCIYMRVLTIPW